MYVEMLHKYTFSQVGETLRDADLMEVIDKRAKQLSGGQKRKLCVALALIGDPKVRQSLSIALILIGDPKVRQSLSVALTLIGDPKVRQSLCVALTLIGDPKVRHC